MVPRHAAIRRSLQRLAFENLRAIFRQLPPGITELGCHPGADESLESAYRAERLTEVTTLCDPRVREELELGGIQLVSFASRPAEAK